MKYTPCEHELVKLPGQVACEVCKVAQAEARIALLEGLLCKVHDDCQHNEHLAFACGDREPPKVGDLVWWTKGSLVREVFSVGDTQALLLNKDGLWDHRVPLSDLVVLKRAEPKP